MHTVPPLRLRLGQCGGKGFVRHANAGLQGDAGACLAVPLHLFMLAVAKLPRRGAGGRRVDLTGGEVSMGRQQRFGKAVEVVLLPFHEPPVHPALLHEKPELLAREVPHQPLHPGHGFVLGVAVFCRDAAHHLPLGQHRVPQGLHTVGRGVLGQLLSHRFRALAAGAVLGHRPVLGQIGVDPLDGLLIIPGGFQPLHIVRQAHIQAAERLVPVLHPTTLPFLILMRQAAAPARSALPRRRRHR